MVKESGKDQFKETIKLKMDILMVIDSRSRPKLQITKNKNKKIKNRKLKIFKTLFNIEEIQAKRRDKNKTQLLKVKSRKPRILSQ
jgi:hypothetical protein